MNKKQRKALITMSTATTPSDMLAAARGAGLATDEGRILLHRGILSELQGVDLSLVDFRGVNFEGNAFVNCPAPGVTFTDCKFDNCWFAAKGAGRASLRGARFENCTLSNTTFGAARLDMREVEFVHTRLRDCTFRIGKLSSSRFERCFLDYVMLRSADLEGATFTGCTLKKVSFEKTDLSKVDFEGVTFQQADFWGPLNLPGIVQNEV